MEKPKKLIISAILTLGLPVLFTPLVTSASPTSPLSPSYRAIYCYDGGTYWTAQKAAYPDYYAANNAYYEAHFGAATRYCPV